MSKKYFWVQETLDNVLEHINTGDAICFQYDNKDYFIEGEYFDSSAQGQVGSYTIADPCVNGEGDFTDMIEYPVSGELKTSEELLASPFLDGRKLVDVFNELKFFD